MYDSKQKHQELHTLEHTIVPRTVIFIIMATTIPWYQDGLWHPGLNQGGEQMTNMRYGLNQGGTISSVKRTAPTHQYKAHSSRQYYHHRHHQCDFKSFWRRSSSSQASFNRHPAVPLWCQSTEGGREWIHCGTWACFNAVLLQYMYSAPAVLLLQYITVHYFSTLLLQLYSSSSTPSVHCSMLMHAVLLPQVSSCMVRIQWDISDEAPRVGLIEQTMTNLLLHFTALVRTD